LIEGSSTVRCMSWLIFIWDAIAIFVLNLLSIYSFTHSLWEYLRIITWLIIDPCLITLPIYILYISYIFSYFHIFSPFSSSPISPYLLNLLSLSYCSFTLVAFVKFSLLYPKIYNIVKLWISSCCTWAFLIHVREVYNSWWLCFYRAMITRGQFITDVDILFTFRRRTYCEYLPCSVRSYFSIHSIHSLIHSPMHIS